MNDAVGAYEYIILDCGVTLKIKILTNLVYGFLETDIGNRFKEVVGNIKLIYGAQNEALLEVVGVIL